MGSNGNGYNKCTSLYKVIIQYGVKSFYYEILEYCETQILADQQEKHYIRSFNSTDSEYGYNLRDGGKLSKETRQKVILSFTKERRQKMSETMKIWHSNNPSPNLGKKRSPEAVKQGSQKNIKHNPELEQAIIKAYSDGEAIKNICEKLNTHAKQLYRILKRFNIPIDRPHVGARGQKWSDETKAKLSKSRKELFRKRREENQTLIK